MTKKEAESSGQDGTNLPLTADLFMDQRFGDPRPHFRGRLEDILSEYGQAQGIPENITFGVYKFVRPWDVQKKDGLRQVLHFVDGIHEAAGKKDFFKASSFNYISDAKTLPQVLDQALENARFMNRLVGPEFFARDGEKRANLFKAQIGDSEFILTCKGGAGAGTFSLDFAINSPSGGLDLRDTPGELWRTGIDTEQTAEGQRSVRIIRTGSGLRKNDPQGKAEKFAEFRKKFKINPKRALAFLSMYVAYGLRAKELKTLTTTGAKNLSSLGLSKTPFDYSRLFREAGFSERPTRNWFVIPDLTNNFYPTIETTAENDHGLHAYETGGMHEILMAFQNLQNQDGNNFPFSLDIPEDRYEIEKVIVTFRAIHGEWRDDISRYINNKT